MTVRRLVLAELGQVAGSHGEADDSRYAATRVDVQCADRLVSIEVADPVTGMRSRRSLELFAEPAATRARILAIAIVEMLAARWNELEHPRRSEDDGAAVPALRAQPLAASEPRWALDAIFGGRAFPGSSPILFGGGVAGLRLVSPWLAVATDLSFERAEEDAPLGTIQATLMTAAPMLMLHHRVGPVVLQSGAGVRVGLARVAGTALDPTEVRSAQHNHLFMGPALAVRVAFVPWRRFALSLTAEGGRAFAGVVARADGQSAVTLSSSWVSVRLGVGTTR